MTGALGLRKEKGFLRKVEDLLPPSPHRDLLFAALVPLDYALSNLHEAETKDNQAKLQFHVEGMTFAYETLRAKRDELMERQEKIRRKINRFIDAA